MKRKHFVLGSAFIIAVAVATGLSATSCGKKKSSVTDTNTGGGSTSAAKAEGSSIAISGRLNITGASSLNFDATDLSALSVYCVTFTNPPVAGTGSVAADGSFSLTLNAAQQAVGCFILDGEDQVGTIVFKNPAKKSISGDAKTEQRQAFSSDTNLGNITLNLTTGKAEVDVSTITSSLKDTKSANESSVAYNFTGKYKIEPVTFNLPKGYATSCAQGDSDCQGPESGMPIWIKRVDGKYTADNSSAFGIMVWESEEAFNACGATLGFNYQDVINEIGIDLSGSGITQGPFTFEQGWGDGWKSPAATLMHSYPVMEKANIGGYDGMKQKFSKYNTWNCSPNGGACSQVEVNQAGYVFFAQNNETGCKVDGKPYELNNWNFDHKTQCTFEQLVGGLNKNVCKKTIEGGKEVTCTHIAGTFLTDGTSVNGYADHNDFVSYGQPASCPAGQYPESSRDGEWKCSDGGELTLGDNCATLSGNDGSDAYKMAQLRCYADSYWSEAEKASRQGKCIRKVETNWMAETADQFIDNDGPDSAVAQHIFELFEYDSANSGSFRSERTRYEGIQVGDNWDTCKISETETFSLRKEENSNNLILEMINEKRNISEKPACVAAYKSKESNEKMMFRMVKQP